VTRQQMPDTIAGQSLALFGFALPVKFNPKFNPKREIE
jgi:hypothetical protein